MPRGRSSGSDRWTLRLPPRAKAPLQHSSFIPGIIKEPNNGLREALDTFRHKWMPTSNHHDRITIYVTGEGYIRKAQIDEMFKTLIDLLGFDSFNLAYAPLWSYLDLLVEDRNLMARDEIRLTQETLNRIDDVKHKKVLKKKVRTLKHTITKNTMMAKYVKKLLAEPLYQAAGIEMPHDMDRLYEKARDLIPTLKPSGELLPYLAEALTSLQDVDLLLNVAPEGCLIGHAS